MVGRGNADLMGMHIDLTSTYFVKSWYLLSLQCTVLYWCFQGMYLVSVTYSLVRYLELINTYLMLTLYALNCTNLVNTRYFSEYLYATELPDLVPYFYLVLTLYVTGTSLVCTCIVYCYHT